MKLCGIHCTTSYHVVVLGGDVVQPADVVVGLQKLGQYLWEISRVRQQLLNVPWATDDRGNPTKYTCITILKNNHKVTTTS